MSNAETRFAITTQELAVLEGVSERTARDWARAFVDEDRPMPGGYTAERRGRRTYAVFLPDGVASVTPNPEREETP